MPNIRFLPMPTEHARALTQGGNDAYGLPPERSLSDGEGNPCRHCLTFIDKGQPKLTVAYRPFRGHHPYAETGPIFLCANECAPWEGEGLPPILSSSPDFLLKGYSLDERICYGTGKTTAQCEIVAYSSKLLERSDIAFVDVRSARNNCFQLRIIRGA